MRPASRSTMLFSAQTKKYTNQILTSDFQEVHA